MRPLQVQRNNTLLRIRLKAKNPEWTNWDHLLKVQRPKLEIGGRTPLKPLSVTKALILDFVTYQTRFRNIR